MWSILIFGIALKDSVTILGAGADSTILTGNVHAEDASGAYINGFTIEDGIHALSASLSLTNCVIADFEGNAIWGTKTDFNLINNVLAGNGQDAIFLHDSSTAIIKNNIIVNNAGFGIAGVESASAAIDYNNVWSNVEDYFEFFPAGENDISEDPQFVEGKMF
jgi:parallel beta-helix repeat protein